MKKLLLILVLTACVIPTGLGDFLQERTDAQDPDTIVCPELEAAIGEVDVCDVRNAIGALIVPRSTLIWRSNDINIVDVNTLGELTAVSVGTAIIEACGPNECRTTTVVAF